MNNEHTHELFHHFLNFNYAKQMLFLRFKISQVKIENVNPNLYKKRYFMHLKKKYIYVV